MTTTRRGETPVLIWVQHTQVGVWQNDKVEIVANYHGN